jgi:myo-inositol-1(or 4)-monophosphatase
LVAIADNIARRTKQLLHVVFGSGLKTPLDVAVADLARLNIAGLFPSYAAAYQAWAAA